MCAAQPIKQSPPREDREPEAATGLQVTQAVSADQYMVATANPYASKAGADILAKGGSAIDAAIAVQLVLTLVEPQSSGIGGGAFILYFDKVNKRLTTFDGRETAPKAATQDLFLTKQGKPVRWIEAVVGGRSVGVPGVLKALEQAHQKYGVLPWADLFGYAIELSEKGFVVSPRMAKLVKMAFNPGVKKLPAAFHYFYPGGLPVNAGVILKNPQLARVYKAIATQGSSVFYNGWIADKIVDAVQQSEIAPGKLAKSDLVNYKARQRDAVCGSYRAYRVCGMGPPSSGGIAVLQILKQLEPYHLKNMPIDSTQIIHLFTQSSRLAFADRARYIGDSDFVQVPVNGLINDKYLTLRSQQINPKLDMGKAQAGHVSLMAVQADDDAIEMPSTSHISIVDTKGNAVSMTTSVEMAFGSAVFVEGFLLNNQLTDFSLSPEVNGQLVANRLAPLKRPRSSMAPTMVFNPDGSLRLVVGSPGGSKIINYVAQTVLAVLEWGLDIQTAINLPRVTNRNDKTTLEKGTYYENLAEKLTDMGHNVSIRDLNSGIQGIEVFPNRLIGGADPRREGKVIGNPKDK